MYLTNNVLRRELEHIAEQPRVPMTTRSAWTTQNILFWGEGTRPADAERHEQIFGREDRAGTLRQRRDADGQ